jgi:ATP adenylyltransferase
MEPLPTASTDRLWTPWRMRYIAGETKEEGCVFCNRLYADDDVQSLILHRGHHVFAIMNLFPYNTGHIMIVPNQHTADPEELEMAALHEMGELLPLLTRVLRRVFACAGFNIGLNVGAVAGAGVAAHLHQHLVPRWVGDANFMPILASTMAIPELIPATYAKIRAELHRELTAASTAVAVILGRDDSQVLIRDGYLPTVTLTPDTPVWTALANGLPPRTSDIAIAGWGGTRRAVQEPAGPVVLTLRARFPSRLPGGWKSLSIDNDEMRPEERATIAHAVDQLAPAIEGPS